MIAGLRWSVDTDRANQDLPTPLCSSVSPAYQFAGCTGDTPLFAQYDPSLAGKTHQPYANFGPQVGFVFSPGDHKTSLRLGTGIFYENDIFNNTSNARSFRGKRKRKLLQRNWHLWWYERIDASERDCRDHGGYCIDRDHLL